MLDARWLGIAQRTGQAVALVAALATTMGEAQGAGGLDVETYAAFYGVSCDVVRSVGAELSAIGAFDSRTGEAAAILERRRAKDRQRKAAKAAADREGRGVSAECPRKAVPPKKREPSSLPSRKREEGSLSSEKVSENWHEAGLAYAVERGIAPGAAPHKLRQYLLWERGRAMKKKALRWENPLDGFKYFIEGHLAQDAERTAKAAQTQLPLGPGLVSSKPAKACATAAQVRQGAWVMLAPDSAAWKAYRADREAAKENLALMDERAKKGEGWSVSATWLSKFEARQGAAA